VKRRGISVLEILIVFVVISVLMALAAPAIQSSRATARRTECQNHLRNLGIAFTAVSEQNRRLPASGYFGTDGTEYHNWVLDVLPWTEQNQLAAEYDRRAGYLAPENFALTRTHLPLLICPVDLSAEDGQGNLSYAVNAGFGWTIPIDQPVTFHPLQAEAEVPLDLNGDGKTGLVDERVAGVGTDRELLYRTGLFFPENWPIGSGTVRKHQLETILDGASNTVLLAESVRSGFDPASGDTWGSPLPRRSSFVLSGYICDSASCSSGNVDYARANQREPGAAAAEALNAALTQPEGEAPWASSWHDGGLNVCFADGHVEFVSEVIAGHIWAALLSPQGLHLEQTPLRQLSQ